MTNSILLQLSISSYVAMMHSTHPCACPANRDGRNCDKLHRIILDMAQKYPENSDFLVLVGQIKLITGYYKDDKQKQKTNKAALWHRKSLDNIYGRPCHVDGGNKADNIPNIKEVFINKLHFHIKQLRLAKLQNPLYSHSSVPYTIDVSGLNADDLGLFTQDKIEASQYWCLPTMSHEMAEFELRKLIQNAVSADSKLLVNVMDSTSRNNIDNSKKENLIVGSLNHLDGRHRRQVYHENFKKNQEENAKKAQAKQERKDQLDSYPSKDASWIKLYEESLKREQELREQLAGEIKMKDDLQQDLNILKDNYDEMVAKHKEIVYNLELDIERERVQREDEDMRRLGLSRFTILNISFHRDHPHLALHLTGFQTFTEYLNYSKCFWPKLDFQEPDVKGKTDITDFEKLTLVKIFVTRNFSYELLATMYGVSAPHVGRIVDEYIEWWSEVGLCLTHLSITPEYLEVSRVKAYKDLKFGDVSFGTDGKDIMTQKVDKSPFGNKALWSAKTSWECVRILSFNLQSGLVVETIIGAGAHNSEVGMVHHWGSHVGNIHLLHDDERVTKRKQLSSDSVFGTVKIEKNEEDPTPKRRKEEGGENGKDCFPSDELILKYIKNLEESSTCTSSSDGGKALRNSISVKKIKEHNAKCLEHWGPDSDSKSKLRQVQILLNLYEYYKKGHLRKCNLTHYIHHMYEDLILMKKCIESQDKTLCLDVEKRFPTRLGKFPKNTRGMGDKGFANIRFSLPNRNVMVFPHFAASGYQFTAAQLMQDKSVKEIRWKDEVVFSRLTEEKFLATIVPYVHLKHLQQGINWGLARSNLGQPIYKPDDYDTFQYKNNI